MSQPICYGHAPRQGRDADALKWNVRARVARAARRAAPAIREALAVVLTIAGMLTIVAASLALDMWIWIPRSGH